MFQQIYYDGDALDIRCYHCKKEGHTRNMCPDRSNDYGEIKDNGNATIFQDGYESFDVLVVSSRNSNKEWVMDSRCTWHMTPNK